MRRVVVGHELANELAARDEGNECKRSNPLPLPRSTPSSVWSGCWIAVDTGQPHNREALADDRRVAHAHDREARHVAAGLSRAADSALDLAGGVLSFFEPGGPPKKEPRETAEERLARLEAVRDELKRIEEQEIAKGRTYIAAREQEDDRARERDRDRDRLK